MKIEAVPSSYELNVSLNGKHLFATHPRSLTHPMDAAKLKELFEKKFPASKGYQIDVSGRVECGVDVTLPLVVDDLPE